MLALVLVDALGVHVEKAGRIDCHIPVSFEDFAQRLFALELDTLPKILECRVIGIALESAQLREIVLPAVADARVQQSRQARITDHHEAARSHAVGLILKFVGPQVMEVAQHGFLRRLRHDVGVGAVAVQDAERLFHSSRSSPPRG